ncbi:uncharacterized protein AB675_4472 [Cyphellophora attinorum]|uniref:DUF7908 domain-containing protein n=1 Tax=Cyphellophora attinorum TaxID=1664694 RepID=A0A0N1NZQ4_9EURO|nr:uncharacterized protein AB675_4472 [Phialophora attinorum]KPI39002.1 hypothetical protein AB675_4472 [Phialophora attinorum]
MVSLTGRLFSLLLVIVTVATVSASEQHSTTPTYVPLPHSRISVNRPATSPTISTKIFSDSTRFQIQLVRTTRRYQAGKRYWAWEGADAVVVNKTQDAAWFYLKDGQLRSDHKRGTLFGKDKWGNIDLTGNEFSFGQGHARFCVSGDGNIFAIASQHPQFRCDGVGLKPKVFSRNPVQYPPGHGNDPKPAISYASPIAPTDRPHWSDSQDPPADPIGQSDGPAHLPSWTDNTPDKPQDASVGEESGTPPPFGPADRGWSPNVPTPTDHGTDYNGLPLQDHSPHESADPPGPPNYPGHDVPPGSQAEQPYQPPAWYDHNGPPWGQQSPPTPTEGPEPDETGHAPLPDPSSDPDPDEGSDDVNITKTLARFKTTTATNNITTTTTLINNTTIIHHPVIIIITITIDTTTKKLPSRPIPYSTLHGPTPAATTDHHQQMPTLPGEAANRRAPSFSNVVVLYFLYLCTALSAGWSCALLLSAGCGGFGGGIRDGDIEVGCRQAVALASGGMIGGSLVIWFVPVGLPTRCLLGLEG